MCRLLACAVIALPVLVAPASAQLENVGNLSFPTSGSPAAQQHFLRGVAILHSFGWKQAIAEFKLAQKAQPDFRDGVLGRDALLQPSAEGGAGRQEPARGARAARARTRDARSPRRRPHAKKGFSTPWRRSGAKATGVSAASPT